MKLGTFILAAAMAMTLGGYVTPADAGKKGSKQHAQQHGSKTKHAHQGNSGGEKHSHKKSGKAYVNPGSKDKGLNVLLRDKKVPDKIKKAVRAEIKRRGDIVYDRRVREEEAKLHGERLISAPDEDPILGLWELGVEAGKGRKLRH
jgi:hypothetical protein